MTKRTLAMLLALLALLLTGCGNAEPKNAEAEIASGNYLYLPWRAA